MASEPSRVTRLPDRRHSLSPQPVRLLLDVDGVINVDTPAHANVVTKVVGVAGFGYTVRIGGPVLSAIRGWVNHPNVEVTWCTTWQFDANTALTPAFNVPTLPVAVGESDHHAWKVDHARTAVRDGQPPVWLDDTEATPPVINSLAGLGPAPVLGIAPNPERGLTTTDLDAVAQFIAATTARQRGEQFR